MQSLLYNRMPDCVFLCMQPRTPTKPPQQDTAQRNTAQHPSSGTVSPSHAQNPSATTPPSPNLPEASPNLPRPSSPSFSSFYITPPSTTTSAAPDPYAADHYATSPSAAPPLTEQLLSLPPPPLHSLQPSLSPSNSYGVPQSLQSGEFLSPKQPDLELDSPHPKPSQSFPQKAQQTNLMRILKQPFHDELDFPHSRHSTAPRTATAIAPPPPLVGGVGNPTTPTSPHLPNPPPPGAQPPTTSSPPTSGAAPLPTPHSPTEARISTPSVSTTQGPYHYSQQHHNQLRELVYRPPTWPAGRDPSSHLPSPTRSTEATSSGTSLFNREAHTSLQQQQPPAISIEQHAQLRNAVQQLLLKAPSAHSTRDVPNMTNTQKLRHNIATSNVSSAQSFYYAQRPDSKVPKQPNSMHSIHSCDKSVASRNNTCSHSSDATTNTYRITSPSSDGSLRTASSSNHGAYLISQRPGVGGYRGPSSEGGNSYYHNNGNLNPSSGSVGAGTGTGTTPFLAPPATTLKGVSAAYRASQGLAVARSEGKSHMSIPSRSFHSSASGAGTGTTPAATADHSMSQKYFRLAALGPESSAYFQSKGSAGVSSILLGLQVSNDGSVASAAAPPSLSTRNESALVATGYYNNTPPSSRGAARRHSSGGAGTSSKGGYSYSYTTPPSSTGHVPPHPVGGRYNYTHTGPSSVGAHPRSSGAYQNPPSSRGSHPNPVLTSMGPHSHGSGAYPPPPSSGGVYNTPPSSMGPHSQSSGAFEFPSPASVGGAHPGSRKPPSSMGPRGSSGRGYPDLQPHSFPEVQSMRDSSTQVFARKKSSRKHRRSHGDAVNNFSALGC